MFDITKFNEGKTAGLMAVVKVDPNPDNVDAITYAVSTKAYDPDTGVRLSDEVEGVAKKDLLDRKAELEKEILAIDAFLLVADGK